MDMPVRADLFVSSRLEPYQNDLWNFIESAVFVRRKGLVLPLPSSMLVRGHGVLNKRLQETYFPKS